MTKLDIIVPVLNEAKNLFELTNRIKKSLSRTKIPYRIIIVDDHSTDETEIVLKKLGKRHPITIISKQGKTGKAYSILEGAKVGDSEYIAMIDGDLQYAPEYIPQMVRLAQRNSLGIVIGNRKVHHDSRLRQFVSRVGHLIYARFVLGINSDTQSGLKVFRREILNHLDESQIKPWAIDMPLIHTAMELGLKIGSIDIDFQGRKYGKSKINFVKTTFEILTSALMLRIKPRRVFELKPEMQNTMVGAGVIYKRKKYVTHSTLSHKQSALVTFTSIQKLVLFTLVVILTIGFIISPQSTAIIFIALLSLVYFLDVFFGLFLVLKSLHHPPELTFDATRLKRIKDEYLPFYSILCPLYKEANILPEFVKNINRLDWPKEKLDVILLLEEEDKETFKKALEMKLPDYFRILVVPDSLPKTKPKACNYGLNYAKGEFVVIYDAEDAPEPEQLKKAFLGFMDSPMNVFCLQAKLNYYNPNQNILTRLFTAEYSLWFDIVLPGLQSIQTSIPLGGTSNHFRTVALRKIEGWDPFNVAEDSDLGARLFRAGYKTAIIDSITLEEANSNVKNWIRQRSRWLKGYMQTYFVQMRTPIQFAREQKGHYLIFQLVSGLRVTFMLINPLLWAMTAAYFLLHKYVGAQIEALYPTSVFYMAVFSAVFGNFLYLYYYMIGAAKREEWGIIKYVFLVPFYWLLTSLGAFMAFYQLLFKPHFWEKTIHGLNVIKAKEVKVIRRMEFSLFKNLGIPGMSKAKALVDSDYFAGAFMIGAAFFANLLNFFYNAYLSRRISLADIGLIGLVGSFIYLIQVPVSALSNAVAHKSASLLGKYEEPVKSFWAKIRFQSIKVSIVLSVIWLALTPTLAHLFKTNNILPILIFAPIWIIGFVGAVDIGFINGNLFFIIGGILVIVEAVVKLALSIVLVESGNHYWLYMAIPVSMTTSFIIGWLFVLSKKGSTEKIEQEINKDFPSKFYISSFVNKLSGIVFLSLDILVAKIFLSPTDAGLYALLSLAGKMVYFFGSQFSGFIVPIISKTEASGAKTERTFYKLLLATGVSSFIGFAVVGLLGKYTAPILFGDNISPVTVYLSIYSAAIVFQTLAGCIVLFHQSKNEHAFPYFGFLISGIQVAFMFVFHANISQLVWTMFYGGLGYLLLATLLHVYYARLKAPANNFLDFFGLFVPRENLAPRESRTNLNILIFNWRDKRHTWSGGAEVYVHELAKRWVIMGHNVTLFCGNDGESPRNETTDGVKIIRRGGFYTVFIWAFLYYILKFRGRFDEIIDSENGIPFFTPLYAKEQVFLLIHHVHQDVFRIRLHPPLSWIGLILERHIMPAVYRNTEVITVSPSSKADILEHKLTAREPSVIYNGVDTTMYTPGVKAKNPMVLYLGRLSKQKSLSVFIKSAKKIIKSVPSVQFVIAGDGDDRLRLMKLTRLLGLQNKIKFTGKVSDKEKVSLYQKAWVFVNPSLMEGWGITTIEANACGTPVVASNVAGLRDSIHNPHSGLLVPYGNVDEFTKAITELLKNEPERKKMSQEAIDWANKFSWEKSAADTLNLF